jgi:hypothetical protein
MKLYNSAPAFNHQYADAVERIAQILLLQETFLTFPTKQKILEIPNFSY